MPAEDETPAPQLVVVGECPRRLWGLTPRERHARAFARAGVREAPAQGDAHGPAIIVRADYVLGEELVRALVHARDAVLCVPAPGGEGSVAVAAHAGTATRAEALALVRAERIEDAGAVPPGLRRLGPEALGSGYNEHLRKREPPLVLSLEHTPAAHIERRMFAAAYKGATDFVTKWCWPVPARWVTRWAAARGITPNAVTTVSLVLVVLAAVLFAGGHYLQAIPIAWAMTFLDTVDGKLARVTLTSSRWGNLYDHGIDLIHPPFWWWAWWLGLEGRPWPVSPSVLEGALWVVLVGYVLGRLLEGVFLHGFKIQTHIWRPIDSAFRTITARRNPNLAILTVAALAGRPDAGLVAVAVWTVISLAFHGVRLGQAAGVRARGGEVRSWLSEPR